MSAEDQNHLSPSGATGRPAISAARQGPGPSLAAAEEIIAEAKNGHMVILVDDAGAENEGDLIIPAQMATPDAINFMAKHGRGLICLALTAQRVSELGLGPMSRNSRSRHGAFTTSIEAKTGVTTGISAADRARTIAVAIDATNGASEIVTPGHVFPLVASEGGVLVRAGSTEAAVDTARLAGLNPSGVTCKILKEDGSIARMEDLIAFAGRHGLKIGAIRDLIAHRRQHDHLIERRAERIFTSRWGGEWKAVSFYNRALREETLALVKGQVDSGRPTLVRMHMLSVFADVFAEPSTRGGLLENSMAMIANAGSGVVVLLNRHTEDSGSLMIEQAEAGNDPALEIQAGQRDYGAGAQILTELGVREMILLTNSHHSLVALEGYGLSVVGERQIGAA